jgi:hypothetical protein
MLAIVCLTHYMLPLHFETPLVSFTCHLAIRTTNRWGRLLLTDRDPQLLSC